MPASTIAEAPLPVAAAFPLYGALADLIDSLAWRLNVAVLLAGFVGIKNGLGFGLA